MSLLEVVRVLQSREICLQRKIDVAWGGLSLLEQPLAGKDAATEALVGHAHFVQYIFQWTLATLVASAEGRKQALSTVPFIAQDGRQSGVVGQEGGKQKLVVHQASLDPSKAEAHPAGGSNSDTLTTKNGAESASPVLDIRLWKLLRASLLSDRLGEDAPVNAALLQVIRSILVSATLDNEAKRGAQAVAELDSVVGTVLRVLLTRFSRSFKPSLDQWAPTVEAALTHPALLSPAHTNGGAPLMGQTIQLLLQGLDTACRTHANPRKVFTLHVSRLLTPLVHARSSLRGTTSDMDQPLPVSGEQGGAQSWTKGMLQALESLLDGGLFHGAHIGGYPDVCMSLEDSMTSIDADDKDVEGGAHPKKRRKKAEGGEASEGATKTKLASYHRLLFQELEAGVKRTDQAVIENLEWFMRAYVAARERHVEDAPRGTKAQEDAAPAQDAVSPEEAPRSRSTPDLAMKKRVSESEPTFRLFAELMRPLLLRLEAGVPDEEALVGLVQGTRLLLAAAKQSGAYVPTEDTPSRAHFHFLERIKAAVFAVAQSTQTPKPSLVTASAEADGVDPASASSQAPAHPAFSPSVIGQVFGFVSVLLETEYRVLENDLVPLWDLLIRAAEAGVGKLSAGTRTPVTSYRADLEAWTASKAVRVGSRLLEVYSELRQVEHILTAFTDAFSSHGSGGASRLVCSPLFLQTLGRVVQKLPMGQAAPLLRMLVRDQTRLHDKSTAGHGGSFLAVLTELHVSILDNIHVSEGNAVAIGNAAREILHSAVASKLTLRLRAWCQKGSVKDVIAGTDAESAGAKRKKQRGKRSGGVEQQVGAEMDVEGSENAALLRVFLSALSLHEHAAGLMPPTAAARAASGLFSLESCPGLDVDSLREADSAGELMGDERSIFAAIGCGSIRLCAVVSCFRGDVGASPQLKYALDCAVLQELETLGRTFKRLERGLADVGSDALLASLQSEAASLVRFVLSFSHLREVDSSQGLVTEKHAVGKDRSKSSKDLKQTAARSLDTACLTACASSAWDGIVSSLTERNYPTARWRLVCLSVDLWAPLVAPAECTAFLGRILDTVENEGNPAAHSEAMHASSLTVRKAEADALGGARLAKEEKIRLWRHVAHEVRRELSLAKPAPLWTAQASTLELLQDASFYEQAAFRKQLPTLLLDEVRTRATAAAADVRREEVPTSVRSEVVGTSAGKGDSVRRPRNAENALEVLRQDDAKARVLPIGVGGLQGLVACEALLRFLSRLGRGFLLPADVVQTASVLLDIERSLLVAALSAASTPSSRCTLLSFVALCHETLDHILARNGRAALSLPAWTPPTDNSPPVPAALSRETHEAIRGADIRAPPLIPSSTEVQAILSIVQGCARAGENTPGFSVVPVVLSIKGVIHTLVANGLEAVEYFPLQVRAPESEEMTAPEVEGISAGDEPISAQGPDDGLLRSILDAILEQCEGARAFLSADQSAQSFSTRASQPEVGPANLLPRTVLLAAKNKGTGRGAALRKATGNGVGTTVKRPSARKEGNAEAAITQGGNGRNLGQSEPVSVGWAETVSAAANASAVLKAVEEAMEGRDKACRAGRDAGLTWRAPGATWQAALDRIESDMVECLSLMVGLRQQTLVSLEEGGRMVGGKGRRVLWGSLEGMETVLQESGGAVDSQKENGDNLPEGAAARGESHSAPLVKELFSSTAEVARLKRVLVGELFAGVGSAMRIRCVLASPHVRLLPDPLPDASATAPTDERPVAPDRASNEPGAANGKRAAEESENPRSSKKRRKAGEGKVTIAEKGVASELEGDEARGRSSAEGSLEKTVEAGANAASPSTRAQHGAGSSPSRALANLGRHLAAASDVIGHFLATAHSDLAGAVESARMLAQLLMFLEAAGRGFPLLHPAPPIAAFDWLVETHLALLAASLPPTPALSGRPQAGGFEAALAAVRSRAEASFGTLMKGASRQQLLRALGAVEDALVDGEGGSRSEAAVGAIAVLLEALSGPKSLRLLASHAPRLLSAIFSVLGSAASQSQPWATTSAGLMTSALQVLTTLVSRDTLFPLSAGHVGLALGVPAALFQTTQIWTPAQSPAFSLQTSRPLEPNLPFMGTVAAFPKADPSIAQPSATSPVDLATSADVAVGECATLCAASRLLQAVLRHRSKEVRRCAALLVGSVQAMLQALATWSQERGREQETRTACAALRRVYEEGCGSDSPIRHLCAVRLVLAVRSAATARKLGRRWATKECASGFEARLRKTSQVYWQGVSRISKKVLDVLETVSNVANMCMCCLFPTSKYRMRCDTLWNLEEYLTWSTYKVAIVVRPTERSVRYAGLTRIEYARPEGVAVSHAS